MTMLDDISFDSAIDVIANYIWSNLDESIYRNGVFLRDGFGRLSFYSEKKIGVRDLKQFNKRAADKFGNHISFGGLLQLPDAPGAVIVAGATKTDAIVLNDMSAEYETIKLVDRRFYGRDWLRTPALHSKSLPPIMVFSSLKGGVGRTTALFALALYLSQQGKNLLLVDLDLEAPGLASMLFSDDERPDFGVIDYLTELGLNGIDDRDLGNFVGLSILTDRSAGQGRVDLIPAAGQRTMDNPAGMIPKLSRALLEKPKKDGGTASLGEQVRDMIERFANQGHYDAILVDARAGLAEVTAGPLLALGGVNLFFGTNHPHTFEGYRYLLGHLSTLPVDAGDDWRERVAFVHAKAGVSEEARVSFNDALYDVLAETFYEYDYDSGVFNYSLDDEDAPHSAWPIFLNGSFVDVDPVRDRGLLQADYYTASFGTFLSNASAALGLDARKIDEEVDLEL
ncbi:AAA family ATPase [Sphingomonas sp. UYEF23]|uniref:tyrosine-protein kinase family protein n=1 Tax=Sphingomonas sp. UYEF23 TaxID=1756408 RepID=UPI003399E8EF